MSALEEIHWRELSHAYGFASDLPALLQQLYAFPSEANSSSEPWHSLWSSLYHQGDIYSASYAAVAVIDELRHDGRRQFETGAAMLGAGERDAATDPAED